MSAAPSVEAGTANVDPTAAAMLEVASLTKRFDARIAVSDLSFAVAGGEILGLVGPNGAGKTTTLRCIAGILVPEFGRISIGGVDASRRPVEAKRRLALVPDEPQLFDRLSVWEHLELAARLYGVDEWQPVAERLLEELEIADRRDTLAEQLSRGMRQKVAVASALVHAPSLIMLDEPLVGLDPRGIRTLFEALRRHAHAGRAVLMSSHLLGQIESQCTRFLILSSGRKLFHGSVSEIAAELPTMHEGATLEEIFFGATEARLGP
jgi:ABC-2 type transport system ATP-binding protein